jgi:hypothetical protein
MTADKVSTSTHYDVMIPEPVPALPPPSPPEQQPHPSPYPPHPPRPPDIRHTPSNPFSAEVIKKCWRAFTVHLETECNLSVAVCAAFSTQGLVSNSLLKLAMISIDNRSTNRPLEKPNYYFIRKTSATDGNWSKYLYGSYFICSSFSTSYCNQQSV